ncbi:hypothetical protein L3X38_040748 [Prunus dulcis]|uniref:Uncharacterized protein n=1 Tax=Prunus dulcis TaxID=3755 RepID=A0AAD4YJP8_PRUDU|nr:hypothetical protein L3X38_040748 [Prunus dulcis]
MYTPFSVCSIADVLQQRDGASCEILTVKFIEHLSAGMSVDKVDPLKDKYYRLKLAIEGLRGRHIYEVIFFMSVNFTSRLSVSTKGDLQYSNQDDIHCYLMRWDIEQKKNGEEFFAVIVDCKEPKAYTVLLRGPSKDLLNGSGKEFAARNILKNPKPWSWWWCYTVNCICYIEAKSSICGSGPYEAAAIAFEAYTTYCGSELRGENVIRTMTTRCRESYAEVEKSWIGIDGNTGVITDVKEKKIVDIFLAYYVALFYFPSLSQYSHLLKLACLLLRIDDIVSGKKKKQPPGAKAPSKPQVETEGDADNEQIIRSAYREHVVISV